MRATELQCGDKLASGGVVIRVSISSKWVRVNALHENGTTTQHVYRPSTIMATPEHPNPGQAEAGHPWSRYRSAANPKYY